MAQRICKYNNVLFRTSYIDYYNGYIATPFGLIKSSLVEYFELDELSMSYQDYMNLPTYK